MPRPIKKIKASKPAAEKVLDTFESLKLRVEARSRQIIIWGAAAIAIIALLGGGFLYKGKQARQASDLEYQGYVAFIALMESEGAPRTELAKRALEIFERASAKRASVYSLYYIGLSRFELGQFDEAAGVFQALIEKYPNDTRFLPPALYRLGLSQARAGKADLAIATFGRFKARGIDAFGDMAMIEKARLLESTGQEAEAMVAYETLLYDYPSSVFAAEARQKVEPASGVTVLDAPGDAPLIFKPTEEQGPGQTDKP